MVDALGVDEAEPEIAEMIVVGGGDGELDAGHASPSDTFAEGLAAPQEQAPR